MQRYLKVVIHGSIFSRTGGLQLPQQCPPHFTRHKMDSRWEPESEKSQLLPRMVLFFWFETTVEPPYTNPHGVGNQVQRQFQDAFHGSIFSRTGDLWLPPPHSPYINRHKMGGRLMPEVEKSHTAPPNWHLLNT